MRDISSVQVDGNPMSQTNFGNSAKPSEAPGKSIGDAFMNEGTEAQKPCLSHVEMRMLTPAAGGLMNTDSA